MLNIKLDRPIAFFDLEATGTSPRADRIVELCIVRIRPDRSEATLSYRINPQMPIPEEAAAIHGIRDEDVKDCPTFPKIAQEVADFLEGCDLGGFNILRYDIPMLAEEFIRAEVPFSVETRRVLDVQRIFHRKEPRDLSAALKFYCGDAHLNAHGAEADVLATIRVFEGQITRYPELPRSIAELDGYCNPQNPDWADQSGRLKWSGGNIVINFGKNKGRTLKDMLEKDRNFINWLLKSDFPADTRQLITNAQKGIWPEPPAADE
jgi:DNA polymerase-3 subunit epsilon